MYDFKNMYMLSYVFKGTFFKQHFVWRNHPAHYFWPLLIGSLGTSTTFSFAHDSNDGDQNTSCSCIHTKCLSYFLGWVSLWSCGRSSPPRWSRGRKRWVLRLSAIWLQGDCTSFYGLWVPLSLHPHQDLMLCDFQVFPTLMGRRQYILLFSSIILITRILVRVLP